MGRGKKKSVALCSEAGTVIKIFKSYSECSRFLGVSGPTVKERVLCLDPDRGPYTKRASLAKNEKAFEHENKFYILKLIA